MNSCVILGKVLSEPQEKNIGSETPVYQILLETDRPFKMMDGSNKKDVFSITLWKGLADECKDTCKVGDFLMVKGRMESECKKINNKDQFLTSIIAEKVTFIKANNNSWQITY